MAIRSPSRTKNGVATIEIMIRMLASADSSALSRPPACATPNRTKPNSPHWIRAKDNRTASVFISPRIIANPKITADFTSRMVPVCIKSGAQARPRTAKSTPSPTLRKNRASSTLFTGSTVAAIRWPSGDVDRITPSRKVPSAIDNPAVSAARAAAKTPRKVTQANAG